MQRETLIPEPLPPWLVQYPPLIERLTQVSPAFAQSKHQKPNHCLLNEYLPGQGIMPHEDGGAYFPCVATVSLGSYTLLDIYKWAEDGPKPSPSGPAADGAAPPPAETRARAREASPCFSILQERRSLLITTGGAYRNFLHGIAERRHDGSQQLATVINAERLTDEELKKKVVAAVGGAKENELELERQTRYSLTFRDVEKVSKGLGAFLAKGKR